MSKVALRSRQRPALLRTGGDHLFLVRYFLGSGSVTLRPWVRVATTMRRPVVFDGRNLLEPRHMRALGFTYMAVGRP
ncbi:hypothetical protein ABZ864_45675 [Streptomyces sp. NPDC047082]|uniref:hypothetical protein n=1 Tax=Streptomyces sp. NPDC047082 TaxID=3155259 RepID=UPI0033E52F0B